MSLSSSSTSLVDLSTGKLNFPFDLIAIPGDGGLDIKLTALYNNADISIKAGTWNDDAPTGVLGLGWSIPETTIRRERYGTGIDLAHDFILIHDGRSYPLRRTDKYSSNGQMYERYDAEGGPFWTIAYVPDKAWWMLRLETGIELRFGGITNHDGYMLGHGDSIEWDFVWNGWIGASAQATNRGYQAIVWHVSEVIGPQGQRLDYSYEQDRLFPLQNRDIYRTQSCRLAKISASGGHAIILNYEKKDANELAQLDSKSATIPDRRNERFLSSITAFHDRVPLFQVTLGYSFLNADTPAQTKRLLTKVQKIRRATPTVSLPIEPASLFDYYGLHGEDRVASSNPDCGTPRYVKRALADTATAIKKYKLNNPHNHDNDFNSYATDPLIWFGEGKVIRTAPDLAEYFIIDGHRHFIPNREIKDKLLRDPDAKPQVVSPEIMQSLPLGDPFLETGSPLIKLDSGKVFLRFSVPGTSLTTLRWVTSPAVMDGLGLRWPEDTSHLSEPPIMGPDVALIEGKLVQATGDPRQYLIINGHRHLIPNMGIRSRLLSETDNVLLLAPEKLSSIPEGDLFISSGAPSFRHGAEIFLRFSRRITNDGASFGALKSITSSSGATTTFHYERKELPQTNRSLLDIKNPTGWSTPRVFFGPDYVVVTRTDQSGKRTLVTIYQWCGTWQLVVSEELDAADDVQVSALPAYAALIVQNHDAKKGHLALYSRSPLEVGSWVKMRKEFSIPGRSTTDNPSFTMSAAANFCAVMTRTEENGNVVGHLHRFLLNDVGTWVDALPVEIDCHPKAVFAFGVCNNYVVTVAVRADDSKKPHIWLAYVDRSRSWQTAYQGDMETFIPYQPAESGLFHGESAHIIDRLEIHARGSYILVQARSAWSAWTVSPQTGPGLPSTERGSPSTKPITIRLYRHFVFNLRDKYYPSLTHIKIDDFKFAEPLTAFSALLGDSDLLIEATDGHFAFIPISNIRMPEGVKLIYRYNGQNWNEARLPMGRSAAFWSDDLTLAVRTSGTEKTTIITQFDPVEEQWKELYSVTTTDIALLQSILLAVQLILLPLAFLPIPFVAQAVFFVLDVGLMAVSAYLDRFDIPGPQGNRYIVCGNNLIYRKADRTISSSVPLPKAADEYFVYDQIVPNESHLLYMTSGSQVRNSVAVLRNGKIFALRALDTMVGTRTTEPSNHQPALSSGNIIVSYLRNGVPGKNDFKNTTAFDLYWLQDNDISGAVCDVVVGRITVDDGFQLHHTCFDYDLNEVRFEALSDQVMYHKARAAAGADRYPAALAFGGDEYAFLNGIGGPTRHPAALGQIYKVQAIGPEVSETHRVVTTKWKMFPRHLTLADNVGRWIAKEIEISVTTDGLVEKTNLQYQLMDGALIRGSPIKFTRSGENLKGDIIELVTDTVFADQMVSGDLTAVPAATITKKLVNHRLIVFRKATAITWTKTSQGSYHPCRTWVWMGEGNPNDLAIEQSKNWDGGPITRISIKGTECEVCDAMGPIYSRLLSADQRLVVAEMRNASFEKREALFFSFEPYEDLSSWQTIRPVQSLAFQSDDAYAGSRCLLVAAGSLLETCQERAVIPRPGAGYILSGYFKASKQFWKAQLGKARVTLVIRRPAVANEEVFITIDLPTEGDNRPDHWISFGRDIDLAAECTRHGWPVTESLRLSLRISNDREGPLLIDCLRLVPRDALLRAEVFHAVTQVPIASLGNNGQIGRVFYRNGDAPLAQLNSDGSLTIEIIGRPADQLQSTIDNPNFRLHLLATSLDIGSRQGDRREKVSFGARDFGFRLGFPAPIPGLSNGRNSSLHVNFGEGLSLALKHQSGVHFLLEIHHRGTCLSREGVTAEDIVDEHFSLDCLVLAIGRSLTVVAGGRIIFSKMAEGLTSDVTFTFTGPRQFYHPHSLLCFVDPQVSIEYLDGIGRVRQTQDIDADASIVMSETLYDEVGRPAVVTQTARKGSDARHPVFGFEPTFVAERLPSNKLFWSVDGAPITGAIRQWLDSDHACERPYQRVQYERSTTSRQVRFTPIGAETGTASSSVTQFYQDVSDPAAIHALAILGISAEDALNRLHITITKHPTQPGMQNPSRVEIADIMGDFFWVGDVADTKINFARTVEQGTSLPKDSPPGALRRTTKWLQAHAGLRSVHLFEDRHDRIIEVRDAETGDKRFIYDSRGRLRFALEGAIPPTNQPADIQYIEYDALDRIIEKGLFRAEWDRPMLQSMADTPTLPDGIWLNRYVYGSNTTTSTQGILGQLLARQPVVPGDFAKLTEPIETIFSYDALGRLIEEATNFADLNLPMNTFYTYDGRSRIASIRDMLGHTVTYRYDNRGRIGAIGTKTKDMDATYARYAYTATGSLRSEQFGPEADPITLRTYTYRPQGELMILNDSRFFRQTLQYQPNTPISEVKMEFHPPLGTANSSYTYDGFGQLCNVAGRFQTRDTTYDEAGNPIQIHADRRNPRLSYLSGSNRLTAIDDTPVQYDRRGNVTQLYNISIEYDFMTNRPARIIAANGRESTFIYDALGRVVLRKKAGVVMLDQWSQTGERIARALSSSEDSASFVHTPFGVIAQIGGFEAQYISRDYLGSARVISKDKKPASVLHYDAYGSLLQFSTKVDRSANSLPFLFTGHAYDLDTDLYDFGARLYSPQLGRFLAPDPVGQYDNPYLFVGNSPVNFVDPSGMVSLKVFRLITGGIRTVIMAGAGALIGGATGAIVGAAGKDRDAAGGAGQGAWLGALTGATIGAVITFATLLRGSFATARSTYPAILYDETFRATFGPVEFEMGRMGAEKMAEAHGIPEKYWGKFLIGHERLDSHTVKLPSDFNGEIFVFAHGTSGQLLYRQGRMGQPRVYQDGGQFAENLKSKLMGYKKIKRIHMGSCYANSANGKEGSFNSVLLEQSGKIFPKLTSVTGEQGISTVAGEFGAGGHIRPYPGDFKVFLQHLFGFWPR
jgi:RHS repeat-associated protein